MGLAIRNAIFTVTWVVALVMQILLAIRWLPIQLCREFTVFNFHGHIQEVYALLRVGVSKIDVQVCRIVTVDEVEELVLVVGPNKKDIVNVPFVQEGF